MVFEGPPEEWVAATRAYRARHRLDPRVVLAPKLGVFHAAQDVHELRVVSAISTLPKHDIEHLLSGGEVLEIACEYCKREFRIPPPACAACSISRNPRESTGRREGG